MLAFITMMNILLTILMDCRPIVAYSENLLSIPLSSELSSAWLCVACMKYIEDIVFEYTSPHDIVNASTEEKFVNPCVLSTESNQLLEFSWREVWWELSRD